MQIIENIDNFKNDGLVLTIGFFDGVHAGHRFLINRMNDIVNAEHLQRAILTFWPHPRLVLNKEYKPCLLNSLPEKIELLQKLPLDYCIITEFTVDLADYSAFDFMKQILKEKLNVKHLFIGYDHKFGKNRETDFDDYVRYGDEIGIKVTQTEPYVENGHAVSSSFIRKLLYAGDIRLASHYMGYSFKIEGTVVEGHKIGRQIGFPTANLRLSFQFKCVPDVGVYAVRVDVEGKRYKGMLYIGNRPTVANGDEPSIEVHLFDFNGDLYGKEISVVFVDKVRDQKKFATVELLKEQLFLDKEKVNEILDTQKSVET